MLILSLFSSTKNNHIPYIVAFAAITIRPSGIYHCRNNHSSLRIVDNSSLPDAHLIFVSAQLVFQIPYGFRHSGLKAFCLGRRKNSRPRHT